MKPSLKACTEERYWEMLEILPPAIMDGKGFMVGEPWTHRQCTVTGRDDRPTFAAFFKSGEKFFETVEPMTVAEYKAITPEIFRGLVSEVRPTFAVTQTRDIRL